MSKKCYEQAHMNCAQFGLWNLYRALSYTSKTLFTDGRTTAERFAGESKSGIYRLRKELENNGWIEETKESKRTKGGTYSATQFRVLTHEQWTKKHGAKA